LDIKMKLQSAVGIDFGGTTVKIGLVSASRRLKSVRVVPTGLVRTPAAFANTVGAALEALVHEAGLRMSQVAGVGIGAPGPVNAASGVIHSMVNVPGWRDVPLAKLLARRIKRPCIVDNDANCFALAEWRAGAGRGSRHMIGLTLGTGVGGGLILDGALYRGAAGAAGEPGHIVIDPRGPRCGCGRKGCLEAWVGTAAIVALGRHAVRRSKRLQSMVRARGGALAPRMLGIAGRAGDPHARAAWKTIGARLGIGVTNLVNLLNPDRVVIGGGIANNWSLFAPSMMAAVRREAMPAAGRAVRIVRAEIGDYAGVVGAAVLVWEHPDA
jgi:glucokinase